MIQRERKREKLISKYATKRQSLKAELKNVETAFFGGYHNLAFRRNHFCLLFQTTNCY